MKAKVIKQLESDHVSTVSFETLDVPTSNLTFSMKPLLKLQAYRMRAMTTDNQPYYDGRSIHCSLIFQSITGPTLLLPL